MSNPTVKEVNEALGQTQENVEALGKTVDSVVESVHKLDQAIVDQDEKIDALTDSSRETGEKLGSILEILMRSQHSMEPAEHDVNEHGMVELVTGTSGEAEVVQAQYKDVDSPEFRQLAENEEFLKERVKIYIQPSAEKQADPVFEVSVNGRGRVFHRGREYTVPRAYVEALARAKPVHFENEEYTKGNGEHAIRNPTRRGLRYPFSVVEDTPRGHKWLQAVMAQP